jgi:hypothetical protein
MSDLEFFLFFFHIPALLQCFFHACMYITLQLYFAWSHFALLRFHCLTFIFFSLLLLFFHTYSFVECSWGIIEWLHVCTCTWGFVLCVAYSFDVSFLCSSFFSLDFRGSCGSRVFLGMYYEIHCWNLIGFC